MESVINIYSYIGTLIRKEEVMEIVCDALNIPIQLINAKTQNEKMINARLIAAYELYRNNIAISDIPSILGINKKRSGISIMLKKYDEKYIYNYIFREHVDTYKEYLKSNNINENYEIV